MNAESYPNLLDCTILTKLIEKCNLSKRMDDLSGLDAFAKLVSTEISQINVLFPEYTPHDKTYHISNLFTIADELLGESVIEQMNTTELYLLIIGLYAHDWGMAISETEKEAIISNNTAAGNILLPNEDTLFENYCQEKRICRQSVKVEDWREYVRRTHAMRSAIRVKSYFAETNASIAQNAFNICIGHWLDFSELENIKSFPIDASICRDIVNVKAIAIYIRLIDLLDIGDDRTPYILWKFVSPQNGVSQMEWHKHRSLQPVAFSNFQNGRRIRIDGTTNDHDVYMSIMDLKRYVNEQFNQCVNLMHRMNHGYHKLNISNIDWNITPDGFNPIPIQFEFERSRMFDILSDDIYGNDPYVFMRELLQNAIDAITIKSELLKRNGKSFTPKILVNINENEDQYIVVISDNGIGMDEYIVKNYLAVAGKSYYKSSDFKALGLSMDPISRFGIGVLSCFMFADSIEVETQKEQDSRTYPRLKINIPSKENYFKIRELPASHDSGTTFKVNILKHKLPHSNQTRNELCFTEYIKETVAFTPYPIEITEHDSTAIIVNPNSDESGDNIFKIDYSFPLNMVAEPQYTQILSDFFEEKQIHIKTDLGLENFDGVMTLLLPRNDDIDVSYSVLSKYDSTFRVVNISSFGNNTSKQELDDLFIENTIMPSKSDYKYTNFYKVYVDGINIRRISYPNINIISKTNYKRTALDHYFYNPHICINMPKPEGMKIDIARNKISMDTKWDTPLWVAYIEYIKQRIATQFNKLSPIKRMISYARLSVYYWIPAHVILEKLIAPENVSLLIVSNSEGMICDPCEPPYLINILPNEIYVSQQQIANHLLSDIKSNKLINKWRGDNVVIANWVREEYEISTLHSLMRLNLEFIKTKYFLSKINFVTSPVGCTHPLASEVMHRISEQYNFTEEDMFDWDLENLDTMQLSYVSNFLRKKNIDFPQVVIFNKPYDEKLLYSHRYLNYNTPFTKWLIKTYIPLFKIVKIKDASSDAIKRLIEKMPFALRVSRKTNCFSISNINYIIGEILKTDISNNLYQNIKFTFSLDDFVSNSVNINEENNTYSLLDPSYSTHFNSDAEWGYDLQKL